MNILVLDDEKEIADLVELYLQSENYHIYKWKRYIKRITAKIYKNSIR